VIPHFGAGCRRVTQPFAARRQTEVYFPARLAYIRHAASVRPEPGSNSPGKVCFSCSQALTRKREKVVFKATPGRKAFSLIPHCLVFKDPQGAGWSLPSLPQRPRWSEARAVPALASTRRHSISKGTTGVNRLGARETGFSLVTLRGD